MQTIEMTFLCDDARHIGLVFVRVRLRSPPKLTNLFVIYKVTKNTFRPWPLFVKNVLNVSQDSVA